jgi:iron(III) transport system permease protein
VVTLNAMAGNLLLRPVGLNTLAVEIWERTSEAMWPEAAVPALTLVGVGLLPVVLLIRLTSRR